MRRKPTLCLAAAVAFTLATAGTAAAATDAPSTTSTSAPAASAAVPAVTPPSPGHVGAAAQPIPDEYIVTLKSANAISVPEQAQQLASRHRGKVFQVYQHALHGFAVRMTPAEAIAMSEEPSVASVSDNGTVHTTDSQPPDPSESPDSIGATGIDRIDQHALPLDNVYHYGATGAGVHAYIIDTGLQTGIADFGGRASFGTDACDGCTPEPPGVDCDGHGTHVAGILGGTEFGVAKDVSLVEVRVLDCDGTGDDAGVIAGVDWVTSHAISPAVANMSLGGSNDPPLDSAIKASEAIRTTDADGNTSVGSTTVTASDAAFSSADIGVELKDSAGNVPAGTTVVSVQSATQATLSAPADTTATDDVFTIGSGVSYAVAAGNNAGDACDDSPADLGLGSTTLTAAASDPLSDTQTYFSNFGTCVSLYAPGLNITSDSPGTNTYLTDQKECPKPPATTCQLSGTSMSTPHVAGTAALYLSEHTTATPAMVKSEVSGDATPNVISNATAGTPNLLDYTGAGPPALTVTPGSDAAQLSWTVPQDGGSPITGFDIYRGSTSGGEAATPIASVPSTMTNYTDSGVPCGKDLFYEVAAVNAVGQTLSNEESIGLCGANYFPLPPDRILDTRKGTGGVPVEPVGAGQTLNVTVVGVGGVPNNGHVTSVVLNVTATDETATSFLTVFPTGEPRPVVSNLNTVANHDVPNLVTVEVGAAGQVSFYNNLGSTDVVADVVGYFDDGSQSGGAIYTSQSPQRVLDTRTTTGGHSGPLGPGGQLTLNLNGDLNPPAGQTVTGVILNVTATDETQASFLTIFPENESRPVVSNLNIYPSTDIANLVAVEVSPGVNPSIDIYNNLGFTDVVADLVGFYTTGGTNGSQFIAVPPARILDTRTSTGGHPGALGAGQTLNLAVAGQGGVASSGASAVVMNVTATDATAASFLAVYPGTSNPGSSNLNVYPGEDVPNLIGHGTRERRCHDLQQRRIGRRGG